MTARSRDKPVVGIVRRSERLRFPDKQGTRTPAFEFESLDFAAVERRMNAYLAQFPATPVDKLRPHQHAGGEFIFVLRGTLSVHMDGDEHVLEAEDSMYFDSGAPHAYRSSGGRPCTAVVVTTL